MIFAPVAVIVPAVWVMFGVPIIAPVQVMVAELLFAVIPPPFRIFIPLNVKDEALVKFETSGVEKTYPVIIHAFPLVVDGQVGLATGFTVIPWVVFVPVSALATLIVGLIEIPLRLELPDVLLLALVKVSLIKLASTDVAIV